MKVGDVVEYQERLYSVQCYCSSKTSFQLVDCFLPINDQYTEYIAMVTETDVTWISPFVKQSREDFTAGVKNHGPLSKSELYATHLALLKARLEKSWMNVVTEEQKEFHESHHVKNIMNCILSLCKRIPDKLYSMCDKGIVTCNITFHISEKDVTYSSTDPVGILWNVPNADGIQRKTLYSYSVYLLRKTFPTESMESLSDSEWISEFLCKYCKDIFPHILFHALSMEDTLPVIVMTIPVDHAISIL